MKITKLHFEDFELNNLDDTEIIGAEDGDILVLSGGKWRNAATQVDVINGIECDASVYVGAAVYMSAGFIAKNTLANEVGTSRMVGFVESKESDTVCSIRVNGPSKGIFTGLIANSEYFLSDVTEGAIMTTLPIGEGHVIVSVGMPISSNRLIVKIGSGVVRS